MGNYFSGPENLPVRPLDQQQRRSLLRVKARMTVKELRELVAQAESGGEDLGALILSKSLMKGDFQVMERPAKTDGRGSVQEATKKLDAIKED